MSNKKQELLNLLDAAQSRITVALEKEFCKMKNAIESSFDQATVVATEVTTPVLQITDEAMQGLINFSGELYNATGLLREFFSPIVVPGGLGELRRGVYFSSYTDDVNKMSGADLVNWPAGFYRDAVTMDTQLLIHANNNPAQNSLHYVPIVFCRLDKPHFILHYPSDLGWVEIRYNNGVINQSHPEVVIPADFYISVLQQLNATFNNIQFTIRNTIG